MHMLALTRMGIACASHHELDRCNCDCARTLLTAFMRSFSSWLSGMWRTISSTLMKPSPLTSSLLKATSIHFAHRLSSCSCGTGNKEQA